MRRLLSPLLATVVLALWSVPMCAQRPSGRGDRIEGLGEPRGAFELLARVEVLYRELPVYADSGTLEVEVPGEPVRRFAFETAFRRPDTFALRLDRVAVPGALSPWKVLWHGPDGSPPQLRTLHWDADRSQVKTAPSLAAELARVFPWGPGGPDASPVPALLLALDVLADPDAAALDGEEPCGAGTCHVVALSRLAGAVSLRLWVERSRGWIRRAEVEIGPPAPAEGAQSALPPPPPGAPDPRTRPPTRWTWSVENIEETAGAADAGILGPGSVLAFVPPPSARRVEAWEPMPGGAGASDGDGPDVAGLDLASFGDVLDVTLTTLRVRVVDRGGRPIRELGPDDFRVTLRTDRGSGQGRGDRKPIPVPVAAVDWVESETGADPMAGGSGDTTGSSGVRLAPDEPWEDPFGAFLTPEPEVHRVLIFVQSDVHAVRTRGHVRFLPWVRDLLDQLPPADPVAVVGYDSHLKLWQGFTLDRDAAWDAVWGAIHFSGEPQTPRASEQGPLYEHFDFEAAKKAAEPEVGLEVAARALVPFAGPKTVIWLGWGLGELSSGRVRKKAEYRPALDALQAADATVFVIDISDAAYHDLEHGLIQVAEDTGGTYAKAHERPDALVRNLTATASGQYLLRLDTGDLPARPGHFEVELVRREGKHRGRILAPPSRWQPPEPAGP